MHSPLPLLCYCAPLTSPVKPRPGLGAQGLSSQLWNEMIVRLRFVSMMIDCEMEEALYDLRNEEEGINF
jgi:hypothetical protein